MSSVCTLAQDDLPLVLRWLGDQLPLSLKLRGEVHAVLTGRDTIQCGVMGDDFIMTTSGWDSLSAAAAGGGDGTALGQQVSAAITRRHYHAGGGDARLKMSLFATDATAAGELLALAESGLHPPPAGVVIAGLDRQYLPLAKKLALAAGHGTLTDYWCEPCVLMWQPTPVAPPAPPQGAVLGSLTAADGPLVNSTWAYGGSAESLRDSVLPCIHHQRTLGLRGGAGELLSWALGDHPYGAIGKVLTLESHRRRGFSAVVCGQLAADIHAAGETKPFCFIVEDNAASQTLFTRLGFELCGAGLDWVGWARVESPL